MTNEENLNPAPPGGDGEFYRYTDFVRPKYNITSIMAYLIGVRKELFEREGFPPEMEIYRELDRHANARIIRNLCAVRTALLKNGGKIYWEFQNSLKNIDSFPDLIPRDALDQLSEDGIKLYKSRPDVNEYIMAVNREISNRINNCKGHFPEWLNWQYIRPLFIMPDGMKVEGVIAASKEYNGDWNRYPYQCYINRPGDTKGNLLYCDEKFVTLLYEMNEDIFTDMSLLRDAGDIAQDDIAWFLDESSRAIVVVDCENSDPVKLAGALSSLSKAGQKKIIKILLFDSDYTTSEWEVLDGAGEKPEKEKNWNILSLLSSFPIERKTVGRLNERKSQVDITLVAETCREVYTNGVDSVVLVSSDSDYWALIKSLADVNFLVMVEREKCGEAIKSALQSEGIRYCYLDDFYTGASYAVKTTAVASVIQEYLDSSIKINVRELLDDVLKNNWMKMTDKERDAFYERYLKKMRVSISADGDLKLVLGE